LRLAALPVAVAVCVSLTVVAVHAREGSHSPGSPHRQKPVRHGPPLYAIHPPSNDLDPDRTPSGAHLRLPAPVKRKVRELTHKESDGSYEDAGVESRPYLHIRDFYGPILKITTPTQYDLYVFKVICRLVDGSYYFVLFDRATGAVTEDPPMIYAKWMSGDGPAPLRRPIVAFRDFDGDGKSELVVQERVHNGTMYNAVIYHFYKIDDKLGLHHVMGLETRLFDLYTEDDNGVITRTIRPISPTKLRLTAVLNRDHAKPEKLGEAILERADAIAPFHITSRHAIKKKYSWLIVGAGSAFGAKSDDDLIANGYRFYY
jgi:hypothetical protein